MLVEQAERHQEQAGLDRGPRRKLVVDVELLDLELALVVGRGHRVLDLELRVEAGAVVEAVADAEHGARQVELRVLRERASGACSRSRRSPTGSSSARCRRVAARGAWAATA